MYFTPRPIILKTGEACLLRPPREEDAEALILFLRTISGETPYLLREPEDCDDDPEQERAYLRAVLAAEDRVMLLCEMDGQIVANAQVSYRKKRRKVSHRGEIGISVLRAHWGKGLGTLLMQEAEAWARGAGLRQLELDFIEGNSRARALYEKTGFRITGCVPDAFRLPDGSLRHEYHMMKLL